MEDRKRLRFGGLAAGARYRLIDHAPEGRTDLVSALRGHDVAQAAKCLIVIVKIGKKQTRYALTDDGVHIAYQVLGQGDRDIVFVPGLMSHLDLLWEDADTAGFSSAWRRWAG